MPGEYIVIARKSGDTWYMGGMSLNKRHFKVNTDFLEDVSWQVSSWYDAPDTNLKPSKLVAKTFTLDKGTTCEFEVMPNGGFVAIFMPVK
jgi:alpha-glucosidase